MPTTSSVAPLLHIVPLDTIDETIRGQFHQDELEIGTPVVGMYARDGLWDDDDVNEVQTGGFDIPWRSSMGQTPDDKQRGNSANSIATATIRSRNRVDNVSATPIDSQRSPVISGPTFLRALDGRTSSSSALGFESLRTSKRASNMPAKSRRGDLSFAAGSTPQLLGSAAPQKSSPSTYMTDTFSFSKPNPSSPSTVRNALQPIVASPLQAQPPVTLKPKSSWKRGVERLWQSKSATGLRDAFHRSGNENIPPVPTLPKVRPMNPVERISRSTPPLGLNGASLAVNIQSERYTTSTALDIFDTPTSLAADPFASSLDLASIGLPSSSFSPRNATPRLSPSLTNLKAALAPRLQKAKSMANIRGTPNLSVPTHRGPLLRGKSEVNETHRLPHISGSPLLQPRPFFSRIIGRSPSLESFKTAESTFCAYPDVILPSPRLLDSPLPDPSFQAVANSPVPSPASSPIALIPVASDSPINTPSGESMKRSESGAIVLPRSRSTSLSIKGPPTSSSFFNLYEQLGIWPGKSEQGVDIKPESNGQPETGAETTIKDVSPQVTPSVPEETPVVPLTSIVSSDSWDAAIGSCSIFDDNVATTGQSVGIDYPDSPTGNCEGPSAMASFASSIACTSSQTTNTTMHQASASSGDNISRASMQVGGVTMNVSRSRSSKQSRNRDGSGSSSRESSRERRPRRSVSDNEHTGSLSSDSSGSDTESEHGDADDVPLSTLHPQAAATQQARLVAAAQRREKRRAERDRRLRVAKATSPSSRLTKGNNSSIARKQKVEDDPPPDILTGHFERVAVSSFKKKETTSSLEAHSAKELAPPKDKSLLADDTFTAPDKLPLTSVSRPNSPQVLSKVGGTVVINPRVTSKALPSVSRVPDTGTRPSENAHTSHVQSLLRDRSSIQPIESAQRSREALSSNAVARDPTAMPKISAPFQMGKPGPVPTPSERIRLNLTSAPTSGSSSVLQRAKPVPVRCLVSSSMAKMISLEIYPETTARDVLGAAMARGDISELSRISGSTPMGWVVCESFSELGLERHIREYEPILNVIRGWDPSVSENCLILRQSPRVISTLARNVPTKAPIAGAWVQCEVKRGKWSKRWLETRGGQVFISRNEKGKDEIQVNTHFADTYLSTRTHSCPKPFVFALKRLEPASAFENPAEHIYFISCEESPGWRLFSAIYDARSFTLAPMREETPLVPNVQPSQRPMAPLVDLKREERWSPFTGRGLLKSRRRENDSKR